MTNLPDPTAESPTKGGALVPPQFLRKHHAAPARTLVDIFQQSVRDYPAAAALDDGTVVTYAEADELIQQGVAELAAAGICAGDRIGVRCSSGTNGLYVAILTVLHAGCAYVPVDADDPDERADLVFGEAQVTAIMTDNGIVIPEGKSRATARAGSTRPAGAPTVDDDCWIIFTSGSTGTPKGVAVTHRSAAAFVDAEARMFLTSSPLGPLGPDDRVLAGLSVGFDASCEEMWLAWAHGGTLVPAPRRLVRSGADLGPWLIRQSVTVVSTVPTLAAMWPVEALDSVRLIIFGGEACPKELVERLAASDDVEVWNTYGPTEATVVTTGARLYPEQEVSIGLPLDGWDTVVVNPDGYPVAVGEVGELIIGGVGLARYLDPAKDAEKFAPLDTLGWERAYRSGDHVRLEEDGLYFVGRIDDQVKIGGRRIELGEVSAAVGALENVHAQTVVVQSTPAGDKVLVGYLSLTDKQAGFDVDQARKQLATAMPAALVPRLHVMDELPVTSSGKVDKKALPWPLVTQAAGFADPVHQWLADTWVSVLGVEVTSPRDDFFHLGGTSLGAATLVAAIRQMVPTCSVRDIYDHPRLATLGERLTEVAQASGIDLPAACAQHSSAAAAGDGDSTSPSGAAASPLAAAAAAAAKDFTPVPLTTSVVQALAQVLLLMVQGVRYVAWMMVANALAAAVGFPLAIDIPLWMTLVVAALVLLPPSRMLVAAVGVRLLCAGLEDGIYPRGGAVHLRLWCADRLVAATGADSIAGSGLMPFFARLLGARIGRGVVMHSLPPVTGRLTIGDFASIEPDSALESYSVVGDSVKLGTLTIDDGARVGSRCVLLPGAHIKQGAHLQAGTCVSEDTKIKKDARYAGSPARRVGRAKHRFPTTEAPRPTSMVVLFTLAGLVAAGAPMTAIAAGLATAAGLWLARHPEPAATLSALTSPGGLPVGTLIDQWWQLVGSCIMYLPVAAAVGIAVYLVYVAAWVRLCGRAIEPGIKPVFSVMGVSLWLTERLLDGCRNHLFFLYAGQLTPLWFRILGADIGKNVEISTSLMIPKLTVVKQGSFLADDTTVGGYEMGGGWLMTDVTTIGKKSFLGNSGVAGPGRKLAKQSLVAVLSLVPKKTRAGTNWWGAPAERLRRTATSCADDNLTYAPTKKLKIIRGLVETLRLLAPLTTYGLYTASVLLLWLVFASSYQNATGHTTPTQAALLATVAAAAATPLVLMVQGVAAALITIAMKWICVQRITPGDHPLWSGFVWLNELQDCFVEMVAGPLFAQPNMGTRWLTMYLRGLGASIGHGCWIDTYWLPEADLVHIGDGATIGDAVVLQTHLFHDRVMVLDTVTVENNATVGLQSVILPAARIDTHAIIQPGSLVMRGDHVPQLTVWQGNPIEPVHAS